ncbi:MAG: ArsR family transcriptional regulator [Candidatus Aenigmarchaeota archaeon]|nr:ArsR family transcriptional regulator [Candidatus Aenigmarchaeota archaeon]
MTEKEDIDWELYSWIVRGSQRKKIITSLSKPKIPTEIKNETKLSIAHVSNVLKQFQEKHIADCLTPEVHSGKIYALTKKGMVVREQIMKYGK